MLPACRIGGEGFAIPTFDLVPSDVEGGMEELGAFQATLHDCCGRSEPRAHFFDYMVGQFSKLERKSIEPMAIEAEGGTIRGLQRVISDVVGDGGRLPFKHIVADWLYGNSPTFLDAIEACVGITAFVAIPSETRCWLQRPRTADKRYRYKGEARAKRVVVAPDSAPRTVATVA